MVLCSFALALMAAPAAQAADIGSSSGPIVKADTSTKLSCAVDHAPAGSPVRGFFRDLGDRSACGTFLAVADTLYAPLLPPASRPATLTQFTAVSQSAVSGTGTLSDPFLVTTVADAGASGLRITQTDSYVVGRESVRTDVQVTNTTGGTKTAKLWRAGDCFQDQNFDGYGSQGTLTGGISCVVGGRLTGPGTELIEWFPISAESGSYQSTYSNLWSKINLRQLFSPSSCDCEAFGETASGLSWDLTLAAGESVTRSTFITFAPDGKQALTMTKTAKRSSTLVAGTTGYTITVSNPNTAAVVLDSITDVLPTGFSYYEGTTTGATTADPTENGNTLTWERPILLPAGGTASIAFDVAVSSTPGTYTDTATAVAQAGYPVTPTGPTAPVTVNDLPAAQPEFGKQVVGEVESGEIKIRRPDGTLFTLKDGDAIPVGSTIDTRKGKLRMVAANDKKGGKANALFYGGVFTVRQQSKPLRTVLKLRQEIGLNACPAISKKSKKASASKKRKRRYLWGNGKGRFQTSGSSGAAIVRGTIWYVEDSCSGTLVKVKRGVVEVRDYARHKTIKVTAGHQYLARRVK
ncbi:unannotated protein [freshwater metagenome]|uniref:Unannotated protein n=1 Tax=freshwater metagenome TaxID=449393 RepID=A0A6J7E082_9ZZZZ